MTNDFDCKKYADDIVTIFKKNLRRIKRKVINNISKSSNKFLQSVVLELCRNVPLQKQLKLIIKKMDIHFLERLLDQYDLCDNYMLDYILMIDGKVQCQIIEHILSGMYVKKRSLLEFTRKKVINYILRSDHIEIIILSDLSNMGLTNIFDIYTLRLAFRLNSIELIEKCINHKLYPDDNCIKYLLMNINEFNFFVKFKQIIKFVSITQNTFVEIIKSNVLYDYCNEKHQIVIKCIESGCVLTDDLISHLFTPNNLFSGIRSGKIQQQIDDILNKNGCDVKTMLLGWIKIKNECRSYNLHKSFASFLEKFINRYSPKIDFDILKSVANASQDKLNKIVMLNFIDQHI